MNPSHVASISANDPYSGRRLVFGHDVGLGDFHRGFHPALGSRIGRLTGEHGDPVVTGEVDGLQVPHRNPGNMRHRDRFLVVRQHVGGGALRQYERFDPARRTPRVRSGPATRSRSDTGSMPTTPRTEPSSSPRSAAHRRSHTAPTSPAPSPTADAPGYGPAGTRPAPSRPRDASTAPTPHSRARRASREPCRRGSCRERQQPIPRSCP